MNDMKTADLEGAALDWAVAKIEYPEPDYSSDDWLTYITVGCSDEGWVFTPSTDWAQGGPIIEREKITPQYMDRGYWRAWTEVGEKAHKVAYGPTPLIAAMRCYVASRLGDEVEIPEEE